ncbi:MAG: hypothetical protein OHK93_005211 [Ramalina farinacea]|uniref:Aminoglycoside phosphotransferase domain-containing protein n=1 Tax=Ramalina farinacea TaxID=258253 RepID=A0AA43QVY9_9LECA|nr:hypothetical protein [Ramalina farinacea]
MSNPADYLPGPISANAINELLVSIGLAKASKIASAKVTADYHSIYRITVPPSGETKSMDLILRVSGHHLPRIKTANEVGVMAWVTENTTIPVPKVIASDESAHNPIAHEYTLLSCVEGETLSDIYSTLDEDQISGILDQLIDILGQLHEHEWDAIGGLNVNAQGEIVLAPVVDETFWQAPDLKLWPSIETVASLNIAGPYRTYVEYISAQIRQYIHLISIHDSLAFMRSDIPRPEAFLAALPRHATELNATKLRLAHKDLHWANLLYDRASNKITAVLDWEFSTISPFQQWDPQRAFLWNGQSGKASLAEKDRLRRQFSERCHARGVTLLQDAAFASPLQEAMHTVANYVRAIVEVSPRNQRVDLAPKWRATALDHVAHFAV